MKVVIKGNPKEIADLALELQNRLCSSRTQDETEVTVNGETIFEAVQRANRGNDSTVLMQKSCLLIL